MTGRPWPALLLSALLALSTAACAREEAASRKPAAGAAGPAIRPPASPPSPRPAAVPAPSPGLPKRDPTPAQRRAWRRILPWPDSCEEAFSPPNPAYGGLVFHQLEPGRYLVQVDCGWGAYQGSQVYFFYDETRQPATAQALTFEVASSPDGERLERTQETELTGVPSFDPAGKELVLFSKSRGPGDCGILARYRFQEGRAVLRELRAKLSCDGRLADEPERWEAVPLP